MAKRASDAGDKADEFTDEEGCDTSPAHLFDLAKIRAKSGGNDSKIAEHGAADQTHAGKEWDVCDPLAAAGHFTADVCEDKPQESGDGTAMDTSLGERAQLE